MKPKLYLETSVPSYYTSRLSRDVVVLAHQEVTRLWWERRLPLFDVYVSELVIEEVRDGDPEAAGRRLDVLAGFPVLRTTSDIENLAATYLTDLTLPGKAVRDATHLAFACSYDIDYLVTWNCAHIANAEIRRHLIDLNAVGKCKTPTICTPRELMGMEDIENVE